MSLWGDPQPWWWHTYVTITTDGTGAVPYTVLGADVASKDDVEMLRAALLQAHERIDELEREQGA